MALLTQTGRRRVRPWVVSGALALLIIAVLAIGQVMAWSAADAASSGATTQERAQAQRFAFEQWDNPMQRMAERAYAVRRTGRDDTDCEVLPGGDSSTWEVTAYTFFGIPMMSVRVDCDGIWPIDP